MTRDVCLLQASSVRFIMFGGVFPLSTTEETPLGYVCFRSGRQRASTSFCGGLERRLELLVAREPKVVIRLMRAEAVDQVVHIDLLLGGHPSSSLFTSLKGERGGEKKNGETGKKMPEEKTPEEMMRKLRGARTMYAPFFFSSA